MHEFREAANETQLAEVDSFKYDKNFHNWFDMEVLKDFTKSRKAIEKSWKKSYGINNARSMPWKKNSYERSHPDECFMDCAVMEKSRFAKICKRKGGLFKCCVSAWTLHTFEKTRNELIEKNLIKDKPTSMCKRKGKQKMNPCEICHADGMCTLRKDGQIINVFMEDYKKEHKVGGFKQTRTEQWGMKFSDCIVGDLCQESLSGTSYDITAYRNAATKEELCQVELVDHYKDSNKTKSEIADFRKLCMKQKSNNIFPCPRKVLKHVKSPRIKKRHKKFRTIMKFKGQKKRKKPRNKFQNLKKKNINAYRLESI